jgi:hypothetical protein
MQEQVLGDDGLRRHVSDSTEWENFVGFTSCEQSGRQLQSVCSNHVVVREPVDQQERS